jgi:hypothetical protein
VTAGPRLSVQGAPAQVPVMPASRRRLSGGAENVVPLVRRGDVARYGPRLLAVLYIVSARFCVGLLRALDARVDLRGHGPRLVAGSWLRMRGPAAMGEVSR